MISSSLLSLTIYHQGDFAFTLTNLHNVIKFATSGMCPLVIPLFFLIGELLSPSKGDVKIWYFPWHCMTPLFVPFRLSFSVLLGIRRMKRHLYISSDLSGYILLLCGVWKWSNRIRRGKTLALYSDSSADWLIGVIKGSNTDRMDHMAGSKKFEIAYCGTLFELVFQFFSKSPVFSRFLFFGTVLIKQHGSHVTRFLSSSSAWKVYWTIEDHSTLPLVKQLKLIISLSCFDHLEHELPQK
ncbi:hypothetical protein PNOK_0474200 [Pyrrhoderma noxium]|uniref:Uncharacterized protein n=1 Tax=Pyrrhoderma noxium TaxID=2282107 RepID=A0A286UJS0_9AGAM|nr:hypothetical protein PNOK_0474200 [Pyrrhoderma noxium]